MKKSVVFGLLLAAALGMEQGAGAQVVQEWVATLNGSLNVSDEPSDLILDHSGNVYVTGFI